MDNNKIYKKTKVYFSLVKEKLWLEEMARKGYLLTNIKSGIHYTFEIGEPKHLVYEIDRFNMPKSPSLHEIHQKEEFLNLAAEMGWRVVTHDEDMNYYFAKEYVEGDINELYDSEEMRLVRANKYRNRFLSQSSSFDKTGFGFGLIMLVLGLVSEMFIMLGLVYVLCLLLINISLKYFADYLYKELRVTTDEWRNLHSKEVNTLSVHKWFLYSKGLIKYLGKQSEKGWKLNSISSSKYVFTKCEPKHINYVIDTKAAVNKRMKDRKLQEFKDKKDTLVQNNDWQVQSVKDADELGLEFICASGNNMVIYADNNGAGELDYTKNTCIKPLTVSYFVWVICGAILGFIGGYLSVSMFK